MLPQWDFILSLDTSLALFLQLLASSLKLLLPLERHLGDLDISLFSGDHGIGWVERLDGWDGLDRFRWVQWFKRLEGLAGLARFTG